MIGPHAEEQELETLASAVVADPRAWIAQSPIALSTAPTYVDGGPVVDETADTGTRTPDGIPLPRLTRQPLDPGPPVGRQAAAQQQQQQQQ